jgi:hypothetical protein
MLPLGRDPCSGRERVSLEDRRVAYDGGNALVDQIEASIRDQRTQAFLGMIVSTQADTLVEYLSEWRRDDSLQPLVSAAPDPIAAESALRVATWSLVAWIPQSALGHRYPNAVNAATEAFGIENPWERRLVFFEPTAVPDAQEFQFARYTLEGMIAVSSGIEDATMNPFLVNEWFATSIGAFSGLKAAMDYVHPQPGFSRLAEVEAEIKARKEQDPTSE